MYGSNYKSTSPLVKDILDILTCKNNYFNSFQSLAAITSINIRDLLEKLCHAHNIQYVSDFVVTK